MAPSISADAQTLNLLFGLYQAIDADEMYAAGLRLLQHAVPSFHFLLGLPSIGAMPLFVRTTMTIEGDFDQYIARMNSVSPLPAVLAAFPDRLVFRLSDHFPGDSIEQAPMYHEFMRIEGWRYSFLIVLRDAENRYIGQVSAVRTPEQGDYTDEEYARLVELQPHFEIAARRVLRIDGARVARDMLERTMQHAPMPLVLLDEDLSPLYRNRAWDGACAIWLNGAGTTRTRQTFALPADIAAIATRLIADWREAFVADRTVQSGQRRTLVHISLPGWQADVQLMIHSGDRLSHPTLAVRIHPPAPGPDIDATSLSLLLQRLTEAERAIARAVASGLDNRAIAAMLHISVNTVRTHLRHIFRKLDIASRSHLAVLLTAAGSESVKHTTTAIPTP